MHCSSKAVDEAADLGINELVLDSFRLNVCVKICM